MSTRKGTSIPCTPSYRSSFAVHSEPCPVSGTVTPTSSGDRSFRDSRLPSSESKLRGRIVDRVVLGVSLIAAALTQAGCGYLRSINEPDVFPVYFQNDLQRDIVLALCNGAPDPSCRNPGYRDRIGRGGTTEENISTDVKTEWAIEDTRGRPFRCVVLFWPHYPGHSERVRLSAASRWSSHCGLMKATR